MFIYKKGDDNCAYYQHIVPSAELTGTGEYTADLNVFQEVFESDAEYGDLRCGELCGSDPR